MMNAIEESGLSYVLDESGVVSWSNQAFLAYQDFGRDNPKCFDQLCEWQQWCLGTLEQGKPHIQTSPVEGLDGEFTQLCISIPGINASQVVFFAFKADIRVSQLDSAILKKLLAEIPANIYWFDPDGTWLGLNQQQLQIIPGDWTVDSLRGKSAYESLGKEGAKVIHDSIKLVREHGKTMIFEGRDPIENRHWVSYKMPLENDGHFMGMLGVSFDISELAEERDARIKAHAEAERALKVREYVLENLQHDIRTPFNGILGLSSYLESREEDSEKKELLQLIVKSSESLISYCNNIIAYTMSRDDAHRLTFRSVSLTECIESVMHAARVAAVHKAIILESVLSEALVPRLITDVFRFQSIVLNLVNNAIKFTDQGSVTLTVDVAENDLCIQCHDTGIGIEPERQEVIFDPFVKRLPSHVSNDDHGSGLGLSIVKQYVQDLGGSISLQSEVGVGTTFKVVLPLWQDKASAEQALNHDRGLHSGD